MTRQFLKSRENWPGELRAATSNNNNKNNINNDNENNNTSN